MIFRIFILRVNNKYLNNFCSTYDTVDLVYVFRGTVSVVIEHEVASCFHQVYIGHQVGD